MKKKPESRKDIIAKLKDESNTLGINFNSVAKFVKNPQVRNKV